MPVTFLSDSFYNSPLETIINPFPLFVKLMPLPTMVVKSHICDKQLKTKRKALVEQVKRIARPQPEKGLLREIRQYNKIVVGIQNYYRIATNISLDAHNLNRAVMTKGGTETVHKLIHATNAKIIQKYLQICKPDMKKLNVLRKQVGNSIFSVD